MSNFIINHKELKTWVREKIMVWELYIERDGKALYFCPADQTFRVIVGDYDQIFHFCQDAARAFNEKKVQPKGTPIERREDECVRLSEVLNK